MAQMDKEAIEKCIKEHDGYLQPLLNDQLYLHCKGFMKIDPVIGQYKNIKALWLQQNAIGTIDNLDELDKLGCIYLHQNCISRISGLEKLSNLHTLNLSQNYITKIEGLGCLTQLESLMLSHNRITDIKALEGVLECPKLSCLDLSHNGLRADTEAGETPDDVISLLKQLPELACLYIQGNELPNQTRYFRRRMVGTVKTLTYMDERPVFPEDRRATDAWMIGGFEAEQAERDAIREEKKAAEKASLLKYRELQEKGRELKEQRERELQAFEEARRQWLEKNKQVHERERKEVMNNEEDARTDLWQGEKRTFANLGQERDADVAAARGRERERAQADALEEQKRLIEAEAQRELEREDQEALARREAYKRQLRQNDLTRQEELAFLQEETKLLDEMEQQSFTHHLEDIEALMTKPVPAAKAAAPAAQSKPRHTDAFANISAKKASIFAKYAAWEARGARKSH